MDELVGVVVSKASATIAVVEVTGEHDLVTEDAIERLLLRLVAENDSVVVDVTNAEYVDSSFLGNLLRVDEVARAEGKRLCLQMGANSTVRRSFDLTLVLERLAHATTRKQALALTEPLQLREPEPESVVSPPASTLTARLIDAFNHRDWELLETLYHPEALLPTTAGYRQPLTPPQLLAVLRATASDGIFRYAIDQLVDLDPRVCVGSGRVRHRVLPHGFADHAQHWLYVFEEGLLWRSGLHQTLPQAKKAFSTNGYSLGLAPLPVARSESA